MYIGILCLLSLCWASVFEAAAISRSSVFRNPICGQSLPNTTRPSVLY